MPTLVDVQDELATRRANREWAKRRLLVAKPGGGWQGFFAHFPPAPQFVVGRHTIGIAEALEQATFGIEHGVSSYQCILCPFRHGKSSMISARYPAWHLGRNHSHEIIMASYGGDLITTFSREARKCVAEPEFKRVFGIGLSKDSRSAEQWHLEGTRGRLSAVGLTGAVLGKGAHVLIIDDPHRGWQATKSRINRDMVWNTFLNDLMSRLAPVHAVIVLMTPLHPDDLLARLEAKMLEDSSFPHFKFLRFPATSPDYPSGYLFPERYSPEWYATMYATLKGAKADAMLDLKPRGEGGNRFEVDAVKIVDKAPDNLKGCIRYWDLASSDTERDTNDPSFTAGVLCGILKIKNDDGVVVPQLWILDMIRGQWEAPARDRKIEGAAIRDKVTVVLETVAGFKDTATRLKQKLHGVTRVARDAKAVDKAIRAEDVEPVVEAGNVCLVRGGWNKDFLDELRDFPDGVHDDQVDAVTGAFAHLWRRPDVWVA